MELFLRFLNAGSALPAFRVAFLFPSATLLGMGSLPLRYNCSFGSLWRPVRNQHGIA